jgi:sarcosine oxidase subunit gamma
MLDPALRQSPLSAKGRTARGGGSGATPVTLGECRHTGKLNLRAGADALAVVAELVGTAPPTTPNTVASDGVRRILWLGPDEWLIAVPPGDETALMARLEDALAGRHASITDVTDSRTVITLAGARARDVLAKGCGLDLHPRVFRAGQCAQTTLARASVLLHQTTDEPAYDITVDRSFARYLWSWLEDASLEFGLSVWRPDPDR